MRRNLCKMFQELRSLADVSASRNVHLLPLAIPITLPRRRFDWNITKSAADQLSSDARLTLNGSSNRPRPVEWALVTNNHIWLAVWGFCSQHHNPNVPGEISTNRWDLTLPVPGMVTFKRVQEKPGGTNAAEGELGESGGTIVRCSLVWWCLQSPCDVHRFVSVKQGSTFDRKSVAFKDHLHRRWIQFKQRKLQWKI